MGGFYSHPLSMSSEEDSKKENQPVNNQSGDDSGFLNTSVGNKDQGKTPQQNEGLICDPRSPNPQISRTPILVAQNKDTGINPLKGKGLHKPPAATQSH